MNGKTLTVKNIWKRYLSNVKIVKSVEYIDELTCRIILDDFSQMELDAVTVSARGICENDELDDDEERWEGKRRK